MSTSIEVGRFVTIPLKKTVDLDISKPLETFIKNTFDKVDDDLKRHIKELNSLRKSAVCKALDKSAGSLSVVAQYYDQFASLNRKVPFRETGGVHVSFSWKDSLEKGSLFSGTTKITSSNGEFECLMVIFNMAALKSQIASESNFSSDDGLKSAAKHFMDAAGMFDYIKDNVMSAINQNPSQDLTPEVLSAFKAIMVAQAQECFYEKANADKMKPDILAKVANQASALYSDAYDAIREVGQSFPSSVGAMCNAKKAMYEIYAHFQQASVAHNNKKFGEEIARLKKIEPSLKPLGKSSDLLQSFNAKDFATRVSVQLKEAEKENNFIYHDPIPRDLAVIGKAAIAKPKTFNDKEIQGAKFTDVFVNLLPLAVHDAMESYENRRKEIIDRETNRLREQNTLINGVMSSLNLPAALEDVSGTGNALPPSILEKSQTVISKGGMQTLEGLLHELPESLTRNQQLLNECLRMLNEEQTSDDELRQKFGDKWKRTPSATLTTAFRQEAQKYQTIIQNAQKADGIIQEKVNTHREGIEMLSLPEPQLKSKIPSASPIAALKDNPVVLELRKLCEQVESLKAEREVIEVELKDAKSDMTEKFTSALASDGVLNEESISIEELDRVYEPLIAQVTDSVHRQESVLANIQRASEQFSVLKSQSGGTNVREELLKKIAAAFDGFQELVANLQEGSKFYNDLTELLLKLQGKCGDLIFARKTEKEELLKDLQQNIVSQKPADAQVPVYQQVNRNTPPSRPPPPKAKSPAPQPPQAAEVKPPVAAPRKSATAPAPPTAAAAPANTPAVGPPANAPYPGQQQPYGYPPGGMPGYAPPGPGGYAPYPGQPQQPYAGYPTQPGVNPGYPQQGYPGQPAPYPPQPGAQYPGYPPQPGQQPYPHQPGYYYPPQ